MICRSLEHATFKIRGSCEDGLDWVFLNGNGWAATRPLGHMEYRIAGKLDDITNEISDDSNLLLRAKTVNNCCRS